MNRMRLPNPRQTPAPTDGWMQALTWMQANTPEPLGDPNAYYKLYNTDYKYPASAYGVTTWWDYGYWVSVIAKRLPSVNPSQDPEPIIKTANLFLSTNATDFGRPDGRNEIGLHHR